MTSEVVTKADELRRPAVRDDRPAWVKKGPARSDRWMPFGALVIFALATRLIALGSLPPTLDAAEFLPPQNAWLGSAAGSQVPGLETALLRLSEAVLGPSALAARAPFAITSALVIVPLSALAGRYLSPWGAWVTGLIYAGVPWSLLVGRQAEPATLAPLLLLTSGWLAVKAWEERRWWLGLAAGLVAGAGLWGDPAGRAVPLVLLALIVAKRLTRSAGRPSRSSWSAGVLVGLALPLAGTLFGIPVGLDRVWASYREASIFAAPPDQWLGLFVGRIWGGLRAFVLQDAAAWEPDRLLPPGAAAFDPLSGILLILGLAIGIRRFRRVWLWWLLLAGPWVIAQVLGGPTPDLGRAVVALPALAFFAGLAWQSLPLPSVAAQRLVQIALLILLPLAVLGNVVGAVRWLTAPEFARTRQPGLQATDLPAWTEDQRRRVEAGQPVEDPVTWARRPDATRPPAPRAARPGQSGQPGQAGQPAPVAAPLAVQLLAIVGGPEAEQLTFREPAGLAFAPGGALWVADSAGRRVLRVSPAGAIEVTVSEEAGGFGEPWDVATDPAGAVYVLDAERNLIVVLGPDGERRGEIGGGIGLFRPRGLALDPAGNLWVADTGGSRIVRLRPSGELISQFGGRDTRLLDQPTDVAADTAGNLYVVEPEPGRLTRFSADGQLGTSWPIAQTDTRVAPRVAVTPNGLIALISPTPGTLETFTPNGQALGSVDLRALAPFSATRPYSIAILGDRVATVDLAGGRLGLLSVAWPGR